MERGEETFGEQWEKEISEFPKEAIIEMLRQRGKEVEILEKGIQKILRSIKGCKTEEDVVDDMERGMQEGGG